MRKYKSYVQGHNSSAQATSNLCNLSAHHAASTLAFEGRETTANKNQKHYFSDV